MFSRLSCLAACFFLTSVQGQNLDSEVELKNEYRLRPLTTTGPAILECRLSPSGFLKCATSRELRLVTCTDISVDPPRELKSTILQEAFSCALPENLGRLNHLWHIRMRGTDGTMSEWQVEGERQVQSEKAFYKEMTYQEKNHHPLVETFDAGLSVAARKANKKSQSAVGAKVLATSDPWQGTMAFDRNEQEGLHIPASFYLGLAFAPGRLGLDRSFQWGTELRARWEGRSGQRHFGPEIVGLARWKPFSFVSSEMALSAFWPKVDLLRRSFSAEWAFIFGEFFSHYLVELRAGYLSEEWSDAQIWQNKGSSLRLQVSYRY